MESQARRFDLLHADPVTLGAMGGLDLELVRILSEARSIAGGDLPWRVHDEDGEGCLVFEVVADDALVARRLVTALHAFCDAQGYRRRFLVARSEPVRFRSAPRMPDGWPPERPEGSDLLEE